MAIAFDEATYDETLTSGTDLIIEGIAHNAGDLLIALASVFNSSGTTMTITGSINGTYTVPSGSEKHPAADANAQIHVQYFENAAGGTETVTFDPTGSASDIDGTVVEVSGALTSDVLDQIVSDEGVVPNGSAYTATVTTAALEQANNIVIGIYTHTGGTHALENGATFTPISEDEDNAASQAFNAQYKLVASTGAAVCDWAEALQIGTTAAWVCICAVFKESGGAPAAHPPLAHITNRSYASIRASNY